MATEKEYQALIDSLSGECERLHKALNDIRAEIERPLRIERYADTESAKAQAIALSWCLEVIDKHTK